MLRVFLTDDHDVVRVGVGDLVNAESDMQVVGEARTVTETLARVPAVKPDVAILDVRLPDGNGVELCRELKSTHPDLKCLMLTSFPDQQALAEAALAGADGYVIKDIRGLELIDAVRRVGGGEQLLDRREVRDLVRQWTSTSTPRVQDPTAVLTEREHTILALIGEGLSNRQIGEHLFLTEKTTKNYVSRVLGKLHLQRRTQAAVLATQLKLQRPDTTR